MILLSARSKAQQYPTRCAYTGAPGVISTLLPAEKHLPNAIMITALPEENKLQLRSLLGLQAQLVTWIELKAALCL